MTDSTEHYSFISQHNWILFHLLNNFNFLTVNNYAMAIHYKCDTDATPTEQSVTTFNWHRGRTNNWQRQARCIVCREIDDLELKLNKGAHAWVRTCSKNSLHQMKS
jgi:hypothetical protein